MNIYTGLEIQKNKAKKENENKKMKFTSEDLMKAMGLQVGDKVKIVGGTSYEIVLYNEIYQIKGIENQGVLLNLYSLLNVDFEILPRPKRVGELHCCVDINCENCPLRSIGGCEWQEGSSLYEILQAIKEYEIKNNRFDQEIHDLIKARLDKEVSE